MRAARKPADPNETIQLQIRMSRATHERLRRAAFKQARSLSAMACLLIDAGSKAALRRQEPAQ